MTSPASDSWRSGSFVWLDLLTDGVAVAEQFYAGLFGWTFVTDGDYAVASIGGAPFAGILEVPKSRREDGRARWLASLSVEDVDAATKTATELGAEVLAGPGALGARGRFVLIGDPQGAQVVLLRSADGDPLESGPAAIGGWLWMELWSRDPTRSLGFYSDLIGYSIVELDDGSGYQILALDDRWKAGVVYLSAENATSAWLPSIRVADAGAAAERAKALGGEVLLAPEQASDDGSVAVIADPSGAVFMVQSWDDEDRLEEATQ